MAFSQGTPTDKYDVTCSLAPRGDRVNAGDSRTNLVYNMPVKLLLTLMFGMVAMTLSGCGGSENKAATINTNKGAIVIEFFAEEAPKTVDNFVSLSKKGFYDGVIFHRVIKEFMIQGGDPTGTGRGGPGYTFEDEFVASRVFDRPGLLAMANSGPNTNGSQFFITLVPTTHLNGRHTIFGRVLKGQEVVDAISLVATGQGDKPINDVVIEGIEIHGSVPGE